MDVQEGDVWAVGKYLSSPQSVLLSFSDYSKFTCLDDDLFAQEHDLYK